MSLGCITVFFASLMIPKLRGGRFVSGAERRASLSEDAFEQIVRLAHPAVAAGLGIGRAPFGKSKAFSISVLWRLSLMLSKPPRPPVRFPLAGAKLFTELLATRLKGVHF